jgi:hypothetical protein
VPVQSLFDYLEAGDTLDEFLRQFPSVTREQAVATLELARDTLLNTTSSCWALPRPWTSKRNRNNRQSRP